MSVLDNGVSEAFVLRASSYLNDVLTCPSRFYMGQAFKSFTEGGRLGCVGLLVLSPPAVSPSGRDCCQQDLQGLSCEPGKREADGGV